MDRRIRSAGQLAVMVAGIWFVSTGQVLAAPMPESSAEALNDANLSDHLDGIERGLMTALEQAEASLKPHQPGSGWTKTHMQKVLDALDGKGMEGRSPVQRLAGAQPEARQISREAGEALEHALAYVHEAETHAAKAIKGKNAPDIHRHARLAAGMLAAAIGRPTATSPVTGALAYAQQSVESAGGPSP